MGEVVGGSVEGDEAPHDGSLYFRSQTHHSAQASATFSFSLKRVVDVLFVFNHDAHTPVLFPTVPAGGDF